MGKRSRAVGIFGEIPASELAGKLLDAQRRADAAEKLAASYLECWNAEHARRVQAEQLVGGLANDKADLTERLVHRDNAVDFWRAEAIRRSPEIRTA